MNYSLKQIGKDLVIINSYMMDNNSAILVKNNKAIIIDPSFAGSDILEYLDSNAIKPIAIILTHAHFDHCNDTSKILDKYDIPVYLHKLDKSTYDTYNCSDWANLEFIKFDKNLKYFDSTKLKIDDFEFDIILTPGHTSGSISIVYNKYAFVGDTLFYNSYGRTDLPNSNENDIINSLKNLYSSIKDDTFVVCGHGKNALLKDIKQANYMVLSLIK